MKTLNQSSFFSLAISVLGFIFTTSLALESFASFNKGLNSSQIKKIEIENINLTQTNESLEKISQFLDKSSVMEELKKIRDNPAAYEKIDLISLIKNLEPFFNELDLKLNDLLQITYSTSQQAFFQKDPTKQAQAATQAAIALTYYKNVYDLVLKTAVPLVLALGSENLMETDHVFAQREMILKRISSYVGMLYIATNDIKKLAAQYDLPLSILSLLKDQSENSSGEDMKKTLSPMNEEQKRALANHLLSYFTRLKEVSLIYTPLVRTGPVIDILTWVGNLTFGLVNSLIGAGIVLTTAIVAPFTPVVDLPTFKLSKNGKQIHVDVSGMSPFPGKLSMGIFELNNSDPDYWSADHEGGHAIQSAILGPLYIPAALLSYMLAGGYQGSFIEDWANNWADL